MKECKQGDLSYVHLKQKDGHSTNLVLFGATYEQYFPIKNLYKALNIFKPDAVIVQLHPDLLL